MKQPDPYLDYESNEDQNWARVLSLLILASWGTYLFVLFTGFYFNDWRIVAATLSGSALLVAPMLLLRRGQLQTASLIFMLIELGTVTFISTVGQGIRDLGVVAFPIIIIFAGLALEQTLFRLCVALTILAAAWLAIGETYGLFVTTPFSGGLTNWFYLLGVLVLLLVAAFAVDVLVSNIRKNLERARTEVLKRKLVEDALRGSNARYDEVTRRIPVGIYTLRIHAGGNVNFEYGSEKLLDMLGIDERALLLDAESVFGAIHPDDRTSLNEANLLAAHSLEPFRWEGRCRIWTQTRWVRIESEPTALPNGDSLWNGVIIDINEGKQAEEAQRQSENRLQNLFETMSEGVILIAPNGQIVQANSAAERILGLSHPEIESRSYIGPDWAIIRPDGTPMPAEEMAGPRAMQEKKPVKDIVMGVKQQDGDVSWINVNAAPLINSTGCLDGVVGTFTDITNRKKVEEALREGEERFRTFIESAPVAVALGRDGKLIYANPMYIKMYGFESQDELIGTPTLERIATISRSASLERSHRRNLGQPTEKEYELTGLRKDGTEFQMLAAVTQVFLPDGPANIGFFQDITERKLAEETLRRNEKQYFDMFDRNMAIMLLIDPLDGLVVKANQAAARFYGYSIEKLETMKMGAINIQPYKLVKSEMEVADNQERHHFNFQHRLASGQVRDVEVYAGPIEFGKRTLMHLIIQDVTDRKKAETELFTAHAELEQRVIDRTADLQAANNALEKSAHAKDEFLAIMSHELRTPLTGILGLAQVMQFNTYGDLNEKQSRAVMNIEKSGQHLLELINEILDFSKLQSGKTNLNLEPSSLANICGASLQMVQSLAEKKNLDMNFTIWPEHIVMRADERRIKQIIVNLLSNAVKFTPDGGSIKLNVIGLADMCQICISVSDTGIGIKEDDIGRLFKPFQQLDTRLSRQYSGTGLGLALVKMLTELHGGSVEVESVFGQGSRFNVILPWVE
jgi:PAS domain S-box-containing protein